jgi:hypothetical protein
MAAERPVVGTVLAGTPRARKGVKPDPIDFELAIIGSRGLAALNDQNLYKIHFLRQLADGTSSAQQEVSEFVDISWYWPDDASWKLMRRVGLVDLSSTTARIIEFDEGATGPPEMGPLFSVEDLRSLLGRAASSQGAMRSVRRSAVEAEAFTRTVTGKKRCKSRATHPDESFFVKMDRTAAAAAATIGDGVGIKPSGVPGAGFGLFATRIFESKGLITMYDGKRLLDGKAEACALEVQTHVGSKDGIYFDGYALAKTATDSDTKCVVGRGGGAFANHSEKPNAEVMLKDGPGYNNVIFLRVKQGKTILPGDEIFTNYGTGRDVAMGMARFTSGGGVELAAGPSDAAAEASDIEGGTGEPPAQRPRLVGGGDAAAPSPPSPQPPPTTTTFAPPSAPSPPSPQPPPPPTTFAPPSAPSPPSPQPPPPPTTFAPPSAQSPPSPPP